MEKKKTKEEEEKRRSLFDISLLFFLFGVIQKVVRDTRMISPPICATRKPRA